VNTDIFWLLVLFVALLRPLDVAVRRITLSPRQLLNTAVTLARERGGGDLEVGMPAELARLRDRVATTRRRHVVGSELPPSRSEEPTGEAVEQPARRTAAQLRAEQRRREEEALSARLLEARRKRRGSGD
jgi:hypothetical protein